LEQIISSNRALQLLIVCILILVFVPGLVRSQYLIDKWTTADGLPQNSVNTIIQTHEGYMWLGTYGGFVRFDGFSFTKIGDEANGLQSERILALCESYDGGIWIGTESRGLAKYLDGSFKSYENASGLDFITVFALYEDRDSVLWIGSTNGVRCIYKGQFRKPPFGNSISTSVKSIRVTRAGDIWFSSVSGVYRYHAGKLDTIKGVGPKKKIQVQTFLMEDADGSLWFYGSEGLIHDISGEVEIISSKLIRNPAIVDKMALDAHGVFWAGGLSAGILSVDLGRKSKIINHPLSDGKNNAKVQCCFIGREGNRWIGTDGDGLVRIKDRLIDVIGPEEGLRHTTIEAVFEDSKKNLWVGTNDGGLYKKSLGRFSQIKFFSTFYESIWSITEDKEGSIWAGSYGSGIWQIKNGGFKNFTTKDGLTYDDVLALYCDRDGIIWMGTERGGVTLYDHGKFKSITEKDGLSNSSVHNFLQDRNGTMWIGTLNGLNKYKNGKITVFTRENGLSNNYVRSIYEDSDGILWFGTYGGGLNRLKDGKFTSITTRNGLYDNVVSVILEDDSSNLWMSCNNGIYRVNRKQLNEFADGKISNVESIAYGTEHGLISNETNGGSQPAGWKTKDGRLLFPTMKGLAVISLKRVTTNRIITPVQIVQVLVNQHEFKIAPRIEIPYGPSRQIEIHYSAINFTDPTLTRYRFRLEGANEDWRDVRGRRVTYFSNLSSGEYRFHVITANADGVWNYEGASVVLIVTPAFWETWYFRIIGLCLIGIFIYLIFMIKQKRQTRILEQQREFSHQLLDLYEAERKRIASELHDSIGQELLIIKNRAMLALGDMKNKANIKEQLNEISDTASQAIQETREISYNLRPYQIDRLGLTKAVESVINRAAKITQVIFTSDIDPIDNVVPKEIEIHLYRIVQESINNIIKHAQATTCKVTIKHWHERLNIDIEDNGKGFDTSSQANQGTPSFGIHGISERARLLGGTARIESIPGKGTRVLLTFTTGEKKK
jgi:signal transduction histidine kinase/ligand-binding sensor domain-containing protein